MDVTWNPWHGCHKLSEGCKNCYVYRIDARCERDASRVTQNDASFFLPIAKKKDGSYKHPSGTLFYTCFSSDFFVEEADAWRDEVWRMIRERSDCRFFLITKRIDRFEACKPDDWGDGYENLTIAVTTENQDRADYRLPIYLRLPMRRRVIVCEPLLEAIDLSAYLGTEVESVTVGGESGEKARACHYDWVLALRGQCERAGVGFSYHQTGTYLYKDGKTYRIPKHKQQEQAHRAGIDLPH